MGDRHTDGLTNEEQGFRVTDPNARDFFSDANWDAAHGADATDDDGVLGAQSIDEYRAMMGREPPQGVWRNSKGQIIGDGIDQH